jgi:hypothetical protein
VRSPIQTYERQKMEKRFLKNVQMESSINKGFEGSVKLWRYTRFWGLACYNTNRFTLTNPKPKIQPGWARSTGCNLFEQKETKATKIHEELNNSVSEKNKVRVGLRVLNPRAGVTCEERFAWSFTFISEISENLGCRVSCRTPRCICQNPPIMTHHSLKPR